MSKSTEKTTQSTASMSDQECNGGRDQDDSDQESGGRACGQPKQQHSADGDNFSLCSSHADEDSLDDEPLPLPGRESHTCDLDYFQTCVNKIRNKKRRDGADPPFNDKFWKFMQEKLEGAQPVGYSDIEAEDGVVHKGPQDNDAFIQKLMGLDLINPIHPNLLAETSGIPLSEVLTELLFATKAGMMTMKLTPNCQRCGSAVCAVERFRDIPTDAYCDGCRYHNSLECLTKIKVVFVINRDVLYVLAENFACQPSKASMAANKVFAVVPATFTGSGFRYSMGCGGEKMMRPALPAGRYRMHCPVARTDNYLVVDRDVTDNDDEETLALHVSDLVCRNPLDERKTLHVEHGKLNVDVFTDTRSFYVLWIQDDLDDDTLLYLPDNERKPYTNAMQLLSHATYQYLYAEETEASLSHVLRRMDKVTSRGEEEPPRKRTRTFSAQIA